MFHDTMHCTLLDFCSTEMKPWYFFFFLHVSLYFLYILNYCINFFNEILKRFKIISHDSSSFTKWKKKIQKNFIFILVFLHKDKLRMRKRSMLSNKKYLIFSLHFLLYNEVFFVFSSFYEKLQWDNGNWEIKIWEMQPVLRQTFVFYSSSWTVENIILF